MSIATGGIGFGAVSTGGGGGTVTDVTGTGIVDSTGGATPNITADGYPFLVYDPAGSTGPGIFTSLALLATKAATLNTAKIIYVRLRGANRTVPAGAYNFGLSPMFMGDAKDFSKKLIWPTGTTMTVKPDIITDLYMESTSTAAIISVTSTVDQYIQLKGQAQIGCAAAGNFYTDAGTVALNVDMTDGAALYASSMGRAFAVAGDLTVNAYGQNYADPNTFYGTISTTLNDISAASIISQTQTGGAALALGIGEDASLVGFTPSVSANWTTVPTLVSGALNSLAARAVASGNTASRPASPVTGQYYFDTDVGQPIWYGGAAWVNAAGVSV